MKTFEEYLDKMGYSWNDFDRAYEMENLIEQYADERVKQVSCLGAVSGSFIFSKYLEDKCPVCDNHIDPDNFYSHTENGGKCMAKYFRCTNCCSEYTVGYNRNRQPIDSEITLIGKIR